MANSLVSQLTSQSSFKLYSSAGLSVLSGVKVERVTAKLSAKLLKNIAEDGTTIVDAKIILPIRITVSAYAETKDAVSKINSLLKDTAERYTLYSRGLYYEGITLASERFDMSEASLSALPVNIVFNGIIRQGDTSTVTAQSGDSDTIIGGITSTVSAATSELTSIVSSLF